MLKRILSLAIATQILSIQINSQEIQSPKLTPAPTSGKHKELIREGVQLHDQGDFQGSIRKYQEVLAENPDDINALYELGFSLFANKDYKKSLETAYKGAQYRSDSLSRFYVLIGNNLDNLNAPEKAIKAYKSGIKLFPDDAQLHFNLAITYIGLSKFDDAKKSLKAAAASDPSHPSSHLGLGQLYQKDNYKIPALLAFNRFLVLEPLSSRSRPALQRMTDIMQSGASKGNDGKQITIFMDPSAKTDEGDFNALNLALSLLSASKHLEENKGKSEMQLTVEGFDTLFSMLKEVDSDKKQSGFAWNYYRPYFIDMKRRNYIEPFCYYIYQSTGSAEVSKWLTENQGKLNEFLSWSKSYQWPKNK